MFAFDQYEKRRHKSKPLRPLQDYDPVSEIDRAALLVWGEHCIECAAPDCFATCSLYVPRPDGRCRRFEYGILRNQSYPSFRGFGAEVAFKTWGKLETRGNVQLMEAARLRRTERILAAASPLINAVGSVFARVTGDARFAHSAYSVLDRVVRALNRRATGGTLPESFVVELHNPMSQPVSAHLSIGVDRAALARTANPANLPKRFSAKLDVPPGYFRRTFPLEDFREVVESGLPFNVSFMPVGDGDCRLVFLTMDFVTWRRNGAGTAPAHGDAAGSAPAAAAKLPGIKCVVFDLDNTMWDGVLLETSNVRVFPEMVELIRHLDSRGILVSIASKNAFDEAWKVVKEIGLEDYFLYPKINWSPKSVNLKAIAEKLNIGIDTFAFVDDSAFERAEVSAALPMVLCLHANTADQTIRNHLRFQGSDSHEAKNRRLYYLQGMARERDQESFGDDYIAFLRSCEIVLDIAPYDSATDDDRVSELVQRTNQLNFSGRKYQDEDLAKVVADHALEKYVLTCSDRFGSYGKVGFCLVRRTPDEVVVEDFMLSCRVQGKFLEQALFAELARRHPFGRPRFVHVRFRETPRNRPAAAVLEALRFARHPAGDGVILDLEANDLTCNFIRVVVPSYAS